MGTFLKKGQSYANFRDEQYQKTMERHRLMNKLREEQRQREAAEQQANAKPPEIEMGDHIAHLKKQMKEILPGQVGELEIMRNVILSLLGVVEFMYERQFKSKPPDEGK